MTAVRLRAAAIMIFLLPAALGVAQTDGGAKALQKELRARWQGKEFYLRGFPAQDHFQTDLVGHPLQPVGVVSWTLSRMHVDHVDVKDGKITIRGPREVEVFRKKGPVFSRFAGNGIRIQVALPTPALSDAAVDALQAGLFLTTHDELVAAVPDYWRDFLEGKKPPKVAKSPPGWRDPQVLDQPDPDFTDLARELHMQGSIFINLLIGKDGSIASMSIVTPMGAGLDDAAIASLQQWKFQPATDASGTPVAAWAVVEVNYRIGD